jgi:hypothetical protein
MVKDIAISLLKLFQIGLLGQPVDNYMCIYVNNTDIISKADPPIEGGENF